jgi:hypothetical protein
MNNKNVILVLGFPKTGTSTISRMLTIMGYSVTGPDMIDSVLSSRLKNFNAFQDFPWFFRYDEFLNSEFELKIIVLKRDKEKWWRSFLKSYGYGEENYPMYFNYCNQLKKNENNKEKFMDIFDSYYDKVNLFLKSYRLEFIEINIETINYVQICSFLNKDLPKDIFGRVQKTPVVNKDNASFRRFKIFSIKRSFRLFLGVFLSNTSLSKFSAFYHRMKSKFL